MNILYQSYLLRIWISDSVADPSWHASLENPHTREITDFPDLAALFCFLREISLPSKSRNEGLPPEKEENEKEDDL